MIDLRPTNQSIISRLLLDPLHQTQPTDRPTNQLIPQGIPLPEFCDVPSLEAAYEAGRV